MFTHRPIFPEDSEVLKVLLKELGYPQTNQSLAQTMEQYTNEGDYYAYLAEYEGKPCGVIAWHVRRLFINANLKMSIEALVVHPDFTRKGVGKYLMNMAERWARANDVWVIELTSGKRRAPTGAHAFYKSLGYTNEGEFEKVYLRKVVGE